MEPKQFDFKALAKQTFNDWKRFFRDNFVFTKVINTKEISEPIVDAIKNKNIPVVSAEEISAPIVNALYKVQESVEMKEGIEEVTVKNIRDAKTDMADVVSVLKDIRDKEYPSFPEIPAQKESVKIDGEVVISKPSWFKPVDLSETNKTLKEIAKKEYPEFPKFPEFPSFADIFQKALSPIKDVLEKILAKPERENPPFEFDEFGRVKVNVDRAGGGGGNSSVMLETKNGEILNPATEEKQDDMITAINGISGTTPYNYIQKDEGATYIYYGYASPTGWKIKRKTVATGVWEVADGSGDYDTNWAARASKTYMYT